METREIPKTEWKEYFDNFSRLHKGKEAEVELMNAALGVQHTARNIPLMGVTAEETSGGKLSLEIMLGDSPSACMSHTIAMPVRVNVAEWNDAWSAAVDVESADGWTLLMRVGPQEETLAPGMVMDDIVQPQSHHAVRAHRINRAQSQDSFERLARRYQGKAVTVHQQSSGVGLQSVIKGLPLLAITVDQTREGEDRTVRIKAGHAEGGTVTELVAAPSIISISQKEGVETALAVESQTGQKLVVDFLPVAPVS